jgi:hypothetical protein
MPTLTTPVPTPSAGKLPVDSEVFVITSPFSPRSFSYSIFDHRIPPDEPTVRSVSVTVTTSPVDTPKPLP